jgi:hypothetical protein
VDSPWPLPSSESVIALLIVGKEMNSIADNSIIALDKFIQSTRDSGYKSTASAVAELVDNALQAGATRIDVRVFEAALYGGDGVNLAVIDNGKGMNVTELRQALRFGGSSRFNDRAGLGRYGMGLPNASLSQARRVSVYSWQRPGKMMWSYLDVDEIAAGTMEIVPAPEPGELPDGIKVNQSKAGTVVVWERCDRLDHRRISTITRKLNDTLGRMFRYFIWEGVEIEVNGQKVRGSDPLFLREDSPVTGGRMFQQPTIIECYCNPEQPKAGVGTVTVVFSELPVAKWQDLPNDEKRRMGVSNGAGVSIVRGGREVDYGWFFMGSKRRENYDDWWRCEIRFEPVLDEAFGITHTKQQIRPREHLLEALQPQMEMMAKALNSRVRQAHTQVKTGKTTSNAETVAEAAENRLRPIPRYSALGQDSKPFKDLVKRHAGLKSAATEPINGKTHYRLVEDDARGSIFFQPLLGESLVVGAINPKHRFFKQLYQPLAEGGTTEANRAAKALQLMLIAAARAEAMFTRKVDQDTVARFRQEWSEILDVLLSEA